VRITAARMNATSDIVTRSESSWVICA
jgi:hypothetical protein